jgi:hypothetical protein
MKFNVILKEKNYNYEVKLDIDKEAFKVLDYIDQEYGISFGEVFMEKFSCGWDDGSFIFQNKEKAQKAKQWLENQAMIFKMVDK